MVRLRLAAAVIAAAAFVTAAAVVSPVLAQSWPDRPVRIIAPFGPGSSPDLMARLLADRLQAKLGQPFVVENRPGAGGNTGTDAVAKATPDGYTLGVSIGGPLVNNTVLYSRLPYDPFKDLLPITLAAWQPNVLVVTPALNVTTLPQLIDLLKRNPGKYNYASIGNGSVSHLAMELIAQKSGTEIVHVPYPGAPQAVQALIAGDTQIAALPASGVMAQVQAGRLRALAQTSATRSALVADVPTFAELGVTDIEAQAWIGVIAPAGVPQTVFEKIRAEVNEALAQPTLVEQLRGQMMEVVAMPTDRFVGYMREELERWGPIIRRNNIKLD
ncbi:MAG: Bug family tripartite tricarboxylate transporter substrate binding protein [Rhodospirillales bacterium]|jgi:tripartite-type tricarboxylate transporter receptor subunit TctC